MKTQTMKVLLPKKDEKSEPEIIRINPFPATYDDLYSAVHQKLKPGNSFNIIFKQELANDQVKTISSEKDFAELIKSGTTFKLNAELIPNEEEEKSSTDYSVVESVIIEKPKQPYMKSPQQLVGNQQNGNESGPTTNKKHDLNPDRSYLDTESYISHDDRESVRSSVIRRSARKKITSRMEIPPDFKEEPQKFMEYVIQTQIQEMRKQIKEEYDSKLETRLVQIRGELKDHYSEEIERLKRQISVEVSTKTDSLSKSQPKSQKESEAKAIDMTAVDALFKKVLLLESKLESCETHISELKGANENQFETLQNNLQEYLRAEIKSVRTSFESEINKLQNNRQESQINALQELIERNQKKLREDLTTEITSVRAGLVKINEQQNRQGSEIQNFQELVENILQAQTENSKQSTSRPDVDLEARIRTLEGKLQKLEVNLLKKIDDLKESSRSELDTEIGKLKKFVDEKCLSIQSRFDQKLEELEITLKNYETQKHVLSELPKEDKKEVPSKHIENMNNSIKLPAEEKKEEPIIHDRKVGDERESKHEPQKDIKTVIVNSIPTEPTETIIIGQKEAEPSQVLSSVKLYRAKLEEDPNDVDCEPNAPIEVSFTIKNTGDIEWQDSTKIGCIDGIYPKYELAIGAAEPGEECDITLKLKAPPYNGVYPTLWRLRYNEGESVKYFGPVITFDINVEGDEEETDAG